MIKPARKLKVLNICCFGVNHLGVPVSAVLAHKCSFLIVTVVDTDPKKVALWNTKQINLREQELEEVLKKCQGRNLMFSTDIRSTVKLADIVLICVKTSDKRKISDLTELEIVIRHIAQGSESNKIIVLTSTAPIGTCESVKNLLSANNPRNLQFTVLSAPIFSYKGRTVPYLLNPDKILIGSDLTPEGIDAAETLESIYLQWVPPERILKMNIWSCEVSKIAQNALVAQRISSISALSILCEEYEADITEVLRALKELPVFGSTFLKPSFGFGGPHLNNDLKYLIFECEQMDLKEVADYWRDELLMNESLKKRFIQAILSRYYNGIKCKKAAIWGTGFKKNLEFSEESMGTDICMSLLKEGGKVNVYDIGEKNDLKDELTKLSEINGLDPTVLLKNYTYYTDPYKSAFKVDLIVVCNELDAYKNIDFNLIYKDMIKPPNIFDASACLPHEELIKIGFIIQSIGKKFDSPDS